MTALRLIVHIAAIVLNVFWGARVIWSVWGLLPPWQRVLLDNPFGHGEGWIVLVSFVTPLLGLFALLWSFPQGRTSQAG